MGCFQILVVLIKEFKFFEKIMQIIKVLDKYREGVEMICSKGAVGPE